jgi:hypothetical protein
MKWFDNWIAKKYHQAHSQKLSPGPQPTSVPNVIGANGMNLSVYKADGGTVIEFRQYDYKTDRHANSLQACLIGSNRYFTRSARIAPAGKMPFRRVAWTQPLVFGLRH